MKVFSKAKYLQPGNEHLAHAMNAEIDVLCRLQPAGHPQIANIVDVIETHASVVSGSLTPRLPGYKLQAL